MAEANQNQGQAQQTAQGAGTTGQAQQTTNPQNQGAQQTAPPAIDYGKIQQMLDGTLAAKEDTALKAYFRQQGLSQEEVEQAIAAFKQQKAANINLVTPTHFAHILARVLSRPVPGGLPVVWNCGGYDAVSALRAQEGKVDIYLPDLKYLSPERAGRYSAALDYPQAAQAAILEMYRQRGPVRFEGDALKSGVLIRHLLLPGGLPEARRVMDWVAETFRPGEVLFSLMSQYTPQPGAKGPLARHVTGAEYRAAVAYMENCGITDGYTQERTSAREEYTPDFDLRGV